MGDKPVLFNIYEFAPPVLKKKHPGLPHEEIDEMLRQRHAHAAGLLKDSLRRNMTVAILDYGDPTLWSGWSWARAYFDEETLEIIPGLSSFNVSNALLERKVDCNGSVVLTTPRGISANRPMLKALAEKGETLCVFMGLKDLPDLVPIFKEYYNLETPAYLVYKAGYAGSEHVIETNLARLEQAAGGYPEKFLGLIYLGPCLGIRGEALRSQRDQETLD
jgi:precorrin-4 methylase